MYDAIIVGARCGGAPLAMLLARAGHKVLLLDRMAIGSDIMSTHFLKRTGASLLHEWGLLDDVVKAGAPTISRLNFHIDDTHLAGEAPPHNGVAHDLTPRRTCLDPILAKAAEDAGAEIRDEFTVSGLEFVNGRVAGVRGSTKGGAEVIERAKVVVGADGPRSIVAKAAGAETYIDAGSHTCGYYAYYSGMRDRDDEASLHILTDERRFYITFPTNDDLDMLFLFWPTEEAKEVRADLDTAFANSLRSVPKLGEKVSRGVRETRISGSHILPNYFRRANGPGWALVGDAALHRDPITAQGITNAFTHASILGEELSAGFAGEKDLDEALADYDRRQFDALKPMFDYTVHLSMLQPLPDDVQQMLPLIKDDPQAVSAFIGAFMGSVPLDQVFPPHILDLFASDVVRGQEENRRVA
jgi:flavin-dependent dehydrogenase